MDHRSACRPARGAMGAARRRAARPVARTDPLCLRVDAEGGDCPADRGASGVVGRLDAGGAAQSAGRSDDPWRGLGCTAGAGLRHAAMAEYARPWSRPCRSGRRRACSADCHGAWRAAWLCACYGHHRGDAGGHACFRHLYRAHTGAGALPAVAGDLERRGAFTRQLARGDPTGCGAGAGGGRSRLAGAATGGPKPWRGHGQGAWGAGRGDTGRGAGVGGVRLGYGLCRGGAGRVCRAGGTGLGTAFGRAQRGASPAGRATGGRAAAVAGGQRAAGACRLRAARTADGRVDRADRRAAFDRFAPAIAQHCPARG